MMLCLKIDLSGQWSIFTKEGGVEGPSPASDLKTDKMEGGGNVSLHVTTRKEVSL